MLEAGYMGTLYMGTLYIGTLYIIHGQIVSSVHGTCTINVHRYTHTIHEYMGSELR